MAYQWRTPCSWSSYQSPYEEGPRYIIVIFLTAIVDVLFLLVSARYAAPSSVPRITKRGVIKVTDETSGLCLGYISRNTCTSAQYRYQSSLEEALLVQLVIKPGSASDRSVKITAEVSVSLRLHPGY